MRHLNKLLLTTAGLGLLTAHTAQAQTGVGTGATAPRTMLDVNGAVSVTETTATVSGNAATVPTGFSLVRLTGTTTGNVALTGASSPAAVTGQLVTIYNTTANEATFNGQAVPAGQAVAFVYSNSGWRAVGDGGAGVAANNGLTKTTGNVIQLGGDLVRATTISNLTSTNTLAVTSPAAADAVVTVGTTTGTAGRLQLGNSNHGILRDLTGSKSVLDNTTLGNVNDMAVYTTNSGGGNLHLVANPNITGSTGLPLGQFTLTPSGNIGIGTPAPASRLQIVSNGNSGAGDDVVLLSYGDNANPAIGIQRARGTATAPTNLVAGDQMGVLGFSGRYNGAPGDFNLSSITGYYQGSGTSAFSDLRLLTSGGERLRVDSVGRVGIGFTYPRQTLAVNGGLRVNNYNGTNDAIRAQGAYLQWNRSNGEGETWLLNQRGGSTNANAGIRFGEVSNTNVITEYGRFLYSGAFRLNAYGANAATTGLVNGSPANYLTIDNDGTLKQTASGSLPNLYTADGTLTADRTVTLGGHPLNFVGSAGNYQFNAPGNTFSTSANSLLITQLSDQFGSSSLSLRNRTSQNGLNVSTSNDQTGARLIGVADVTLQTQGSGANTSAYRVKQANLRTETRINGKSAATFTYVLGPYSATTDSTEVQIFTNPSINGSASNSYNTGIAVGSNYALVSNRLGINSGTNVIGSRLSVSPTATEAKITLYDGGVDGRTSSTATTTHYGFGVSNNAQLNYDVMSGGSHVFYVNSKNGSGTEVLRANAAGLSTSLKVQLTPAAGAQAFAMNSNGIFGLDAAGVTNGRFVVLESGNVGIGVASPTAYKLQVAGDINATGSVRSNGTALTSDARLKRNVTPLAGGLATVAQLRPVQYDKKATLESSEYSRHELGFIAQELRQVLPTLVSEGKDAGKTLAVSYTELIPVLTKAMQEQQAQIAALQAANAQLQRQAAAGASAQAELQDVKASLHSLREAVQQLQGGAATANAGK